MNNETTRLIFKYDGNGLNEHKMDLELLADALKGTASLLSEVNTLINPTSAALDVKIEAIQPGSFEFVIDVIQNPQEYLDILAVIGFGSAFGTASLVSLVQWINNRKIEKLQLTKEGNCKIIVDGETKDVPSYFNRLLASPSIRKSLSKIVHTPLQTEGISSFKIIDNSSVEKFAVTSEQSSPFKSIRNPVEDSSVRKEDPEACIQFITVHMDKKSAWRISYQDNTISAAMEDDEFWDRVKNDREKNLFHSTFNATIVEVGDLYSLDKRYVIKKIHRESEN